MATQLPPIGACIQPLEKMTQNQRKRQGRRNASASKKPNYYNFWKKTHHPNFYFFEVWAPIEKQIPLYGAAKRLRRVHRKAAQGHAFQIAPAGQEFGLSKMAEKGGQAGSCAVKVEIVTESAKRGSGRNPGLVGIDLPRMHIE